MGALPKVTLYTKPDCKLCVPVDEVIRRVGDDEDFDYEKVDITDDAELTRLYGNEIPVVAIDGRKAFKGKMTEQAFKKRLAKAQRASEADGPTVEALENVAPPPYIPARGATVFLGAAIALAFGYQILEGLEDAKIGRGTVSSKLLRVDEKSEPPIDFTLTTMDGKKASLRDYSDKVVFLNFWATWCPPCIEEMPSMRRLATKFQSDDRFVMLAVSADEEWKPVREFFAKDAAPFPVLLDASGEKAKEYGTEKFPETYVIVDGRLVGHIVGPRDWDKWYAEGYLRSLIENR